LEDNLTRMHNYDKIMLNHYTTNGVNNESD
jgi:hypothetical protein